MDLSEYRKQLDDIDRQLVELFEKRMEVSGRIADYKAENQIPVYDAARERQKLDAVEQLATEAYSKASVRDLFEQIMAISRRVQYVKLAGQGRGVDLGFEKIPELPMKDVKVVYQGVEGSYGHAATLRYFGDQADIYHVLTFEEAMQEVQEGRADYAVLPIENSSAGAVTDNYDLLLKYHNYIVAEIFLPVSHALLTRQEADISQIRTVFSHPQGLMQCSDFLNAQKEWKQVSLVNTAVAARKVMEDGDPTQAAVASEIAGKLYGLKVLRSSIQNNKQNTTRFMILSRRPVYRADASRISICFELPHRCGTLYNMLGHFIFNDVNMVMIQSRPVAGRNWEYRFFIDIEGNLEDAGIQNALSGIAAEARNLRIFGNY